MALPISVRNQVARIVQQWASVGYFPLGKNLELLRKVAQEDPPAVEPIVGLLVPFFNSGVISPSYITSCLNLLRHFANASEHLRSLIHESIDHDLIEHYCGDERESKYALQFAEVLKIGHPRHYLDLAREGKAG